MIRSYTSSRLRLLGTPIFSRGVKSSCLVLHGHMVVVHFSLRTLRYWRLHARRRAVLVDACWRERLPAQGPVAAGRMIPVYQSLLSSMLLRQARRRRLQSRLAQFQSRSIDARRARSSVTLVISLLLKRGTYVEEDTAPPWPAGMSVLRYFHIAERSIEFDTARFSCCPGPRVRIDTLGRRRGLAHERQVAICRWNLNSRKVAFDAMRRRTDGCALFDPVGAPGAAPRNSSYLGLDNFQFPSQPRLAHSDM